jgi:hypothetical protein
MDIEKVNAMAPGDTALPPILRDLLGYYEGKMADGQAPVRGEHFSPTALRPWLGSLAIIALEDGEYRCRLMGTKLLPRFGREITGLLLTDIDPTIAGDLVDLAKQCVSLVGPVIGRAASVDGRYDYVEVLLPLRGRAGNIDTVLLASFQLGSPN